MEVQWISVSTPPEYEMQVWMTDGNYVVAAMYDGIAFMVDKEPTKWARIEYPMPPQNS